MKKGNAQQRQLGQHGIGSTTETVVQESHVPENQAVDDHRECETALVLGLDQAIARYGRSFMILIAGAPAAALALWGANALGIWLRGIAIARLSERNRKRLLEIVLYGITVVAIVGPALALYNLSRRGELDLRQARQRLAEASPDSLLASATAQSDQARALAQSAEQLLAELDRTEAILGRARQDIRQALSAANAQLASVDSAGAGVQSLARRQQELDEQVSALSKALRGREPISREDLLSAERVGRWQGIVYGVVASALWAFLAWLVKHGWQRVNAKR